MSSLRTVVVSGGFDPVHIGHIRMFIEARALGDRLLVILNNDNWLLAKKGSCLWKKISVLKCYWLCGWSMKC